MPQSVFEGCSCRCAIGAAAVVIGLVAAAGCEDEIYRVGARPWTPSSGAGASAGAGGEGGAGGAEGGASAGGGAPTGIECLDSSFHDEVLTFGQAGLCLVARYTAAVEVGFTLSPTWGLHGGPLTATYQHQPDGEATIARWLVPAEPLGTLAQQSTRVRLAIAADPVFFGAQVVDLPFYWWTLVSWTGPFGSSEGEAILLLDDTVAERRPVAGLYGSVGIGRPFEPGRVIHSSLTALGDGSGTQAAGLYAGDYCMGPPPISCGTTPIATWGEANGPLAADQQSNVFAVQTWFSTGLQSLRGFEATTLSPHAPATEGDVLLTMPGFGTELAAMSPTTASPGLALFQPYDATTFEALDIIALPYSVSHANIEPGGAVTVAFSMVSRGTPVTLMTDLDGRAWVGVVTSPGTTTFYVLDRDPEAGR